MALLSPAGGVLADRFPKRDLLVVGRALIAAIAFGVGALVASETIAIAHVLIASFLGGVLAAGLQPATQTYVFDLVGRERVESAVALNATGGGIAQVAGPALAGSLIAAVGLAFTFMGAAAGVLVAGLLLLVVPVRGTSGAARRRVLDDLREGFVWVRNDPPVRLVLIGCTMAIFNGAVFSMRAVFARHVLEVGSLGYGGLAAAQGAGTVVVALLLTGLPLRRPGIAIIASMLGYAACIVAYALAFSYEYVLAIEFLLGVTGQVWNVTTVSGLQLAVPEAMRGRILGMVFMLAQLGFLGQLAVGVLADRVGDQLALGIFGVIPTVVLTGVLVMGWRLLRQVGAFRA